MKSIQGKRYLTCNCCQTEFELDPYKLKKEYFSNHNTVIKELLYPSIDYTSKDDFSPVLLFMIDVSPLSLNLGFTSNVLLI